MSENKTENKIQIPPIGGYILTESFNDVPFYVEFLYSPKKEDFVRGDLIKTDYGEFTIRYKIPFGEHYVLGIDYCFVPKCDTPIYRLYINTVKISIKSEDELLKNEFDVEYKTVDRVMAYIPRKKIDNVGILFMGDDDKKLGVKNLGLYKLIEYAKIHNKKFKDEFYYLTEIPSIREFADKNGILSFCKSINCIKGDIQNLQKLLEEEK